MRAILATVLVAILTPVGALAQTHTTASLRATWAPGLDGRTQQLEGAFEARIERSLGRCDAKAGLRLRFDIADALEPGRPDDSSSRWPLTRRAFSADHLDVELREATIACPWRKSQWSVGKQSLVWGQADGFKVLDVVTPQSFRQFFSEEPEDARIPVWLARLEVPLGRVRLQFLYVPDRTVHDLVSSTGTEPFPVFGFVSPRLSPQAGLSALLDGSLGSSPSALHTLHAVDLGLDAETASQLFGTSELSLGAVLSSGVQMSSSVREPVPTTDRWASQGGLAASWRSAGWDLSLHYFHHIDRTPSYSREVRLSGLTDRATPTLEVTFEREHHEVDLWGLSAANAFGDWAVRAEVGYLPRRRQSVLDLNGPHRGSSAGLAELDELQSVLGLDYFGVRGTLVSAQLFWTRRSTRGLHPARPPIERVATALVRWTDDFDRKRFRLLWALDLASEDAWIQLRASYAMTDRLRLLVGLDSFYGDAAGIFGQFSARDRAILGIELDL